MKTGIFFKGQEVCIAATGLKLGAKGKIINGGDLISDDMTKAGHQPLTALERNSLAEQGCMSYAGLRRKLRRKLAELGRHDLMKHSLRHTTKFGQQAEKFRTAKQLAKAA